MAPEPRITINGTPLTEAQAMTVRVGLAMFAMDLEDPELMAGLGEIGPLYQERLREVVRIMLR